MTQRSRRPTTPLLRGVAIACIAATALTGVATPASAQLFGRKKKVEAVAPPPAPPAPPVAMSGSVLAAARS